MKYQIQPDLNAKEMEQSYENNIDLKQQSYTQKRGFLINWDKVQMSYVLFTLADVKKHHHLCSMRPFMLI